MIKWHKTNELATIPTRATTGSAGYDIYALCDAVIQPGEYKLIHTGVTAEMPEGIELQIRPRSGLALRYGVTVLNAPGTVDSDYYPDAIGVILVNHGVKPYIVGVGDRIAQGVFSAYKLATVDNTVDKRTGGFGHTGR